MDKILTADAWLSRHLGCGAYKAVLPAASDSQRAARLREELQALPAARHFLYAKVPVLDLAQAEILSAQGFRLVDTAVNLAKTAVRSSRLEPGPCRFASPGDEAAVVEIARRSFSLSRFHLDDRIGRDTANRIKAEWVASFFRGARGTHMVVAEADGVVAGFCQIIVRAGGVLGIDLIAVDVPLRGRGLGRALCAFAEQQCGAVRVCEVVTQIANTASLQLYQNLGYVIRDAAYVFHALGGG